jgi:hypothetical protein
MHGSTATSAIDRTVDVVEYFDEREASAIGVKGCMAILLRRFYSCLVGDELSVVNAAESRPLTKSGRRQRRRKKKTRPRKECAEIPDADVFVLDCSDDDEGDEKEMEREEPSAAAAADGLERSRRGDAARTAAAATASDEARAVAKEARTDFSGTWSLDRTRSDDPTAQLAALGVGWVARTAIASAPRTVEITQSTSAEGGGALAHWSEKVSTSVITRESAFEVGAPGAAKRTMDTSPIDSTVVELETEWAEAGTSVVTRSVYTGKQLVGVVQRWLEEGGRTYHVRNTIAPRRGRGKNLVVNTYFARLSK